MAKEALHDLRQQVTDLPGRTLVGIATAIPSGPGVLYVSGGVISAEQPLSVAHGGTGRATLDNEAVLLGSGTSAVLMEAPLGVTHGGTGNQFITGVLLGNGANPLTAEAPLTVPHGGTGVVSATAYAVLCGGTTGTGALQSVSGLGTSGFVLVSNGAGALPTWQAAASPITGLTTNKIPKAASASSLTDSIMSEAGGAIAVAGAMAVTGHLTPGAHALYDLGASPSPGWRSLYLGELTNDGVGRLIPGVLPISPVTWTIPGTTGNVVIDVATQTLTGKTLTTPTIASFVNATHNHSNAAGGGVLSAYALTDFSNITSVSVDLVPGADATFSLGSNVQAWKELRMHGFIELRNSTDPGAGSVSRLRIFAETGSLTWYGGDLFKNAFVTAHTANRSYTWPDADGAVVLDTATQTLTNKSLDASSLTSGTLGVARGGTGAATLAAHGVVVGNGTSAVAVTGAGTAGQILTSNGASADPTFQAPSALGTVTTGLDRNRPSASTRVASYFATDTFQTYVSDGTSWYVVGAGPDKATLDGFSDILYYQASGSTSTTNSGPTFDAGGYTLLVGLYFASLAGTTQMIPLNYSDASFTRGWHFDTSTTNSNKMSLFLKGVNSSAALEMSGNATITTGFHVFAMNYNGTSVRYCMDGGTVNAISVSGTYLAPNSTTQGYWLGRWASGTLPFSIGGIGFVQGYASALSDGDMQTLGANGANYLPGVISTAPAYDWQARWGRQGARSLVVYGSTATPDNALIFRPDAFSPGVVKKTAR